MTKKTTDEVYMLLLMRDDTNGDGKGVNLVGAAYDMVKKEGRKLEVEEVPEDSVVFTGYCLRDMDVLCSEVVMDHAKILKDNPDITHESMYIKLLTDFADKPMELIGNMLAGMLTGCIISMASDPDMASEVDRWGT
jgi:hypothetical protein